MLGCAELRSGRVGRPLIVARSKRLPSLSLRVRHRSHDQRVAFCVFAPTSRPHKILELTFRMLAFRW